jgi:hypothetical protein
MSIGIIKAGLRSDRFKIKEAVELAGCIIVKTVDFSTAPTLVIFLGTDDQIISAFKNAESVSGEGTRTFTHLRDISLKLVNVLKDQPRTRFQGAAYTGIFETDGLEVLLSAANIMTIFEDVELVEIQLSGNPFEKSVFVISGTKKAVEEALESAKIISQSAHFTLQGNTQSPPDGRQP